MNHGFALLRRAAPLALALAFMAPVAHAQDDYDDGDSAPAASGEALEGRPWYVSPMFSYTFMDGDRGLDDGLGGKIAVGKKVTSGMTLEVTGFFSVADPETGNGATAELKGAGIGANVSLFNSLPNMYLALALMRGAVSDHPGAIANYEGTVFDLGLGYLFSLGDRVKLRAEAIYRTDAHDRKNAGIDPGNKHFQDGVINQGLLFPLGSPAPVESEPVAVVEPAVVDTGIDSDGDGVPDDRDNCPDKPAGIQVGPDGCPVDSDGDGIPDYLDECPNSPAGAKVLQNGCALTGDCRRPRAGEQIDENGCAVEQRFILKGVKFEFDSDRLTEEAKLILNEVAGTLQAYPNVNVELQGHTDSIGSDAYNQGLAERRAIAVKTYLSGREVAAGRMTPVGYGEAQPIASNDTEEGREENRRVELKVLD